MLARGETEELVSDLWRIGAQAQISVGVRRDFEDLVDSLEGVQGGMHHQADLGRNFWIRFEQRQAGVLRGGPRVVRGLGNDSEGLVRAAGLRLDEVVTDRIGLFLVQGNQRRDDGGASDRGRLRAIAGLEDFDVASLIVRNRVWVSDQSGRNVHEHLLDCFAKVRVVLIRCGILNRGYATHTGGHRAGCAVKELEAEIEVGVLA